MNPRQNPLLLILAVFSLFSLFALSACVTTREQMNRERGIGTQESGSSGNAASEPSSTVKSEDLNQNNPAPAPQAQSPVTQGPPATAGSVPAPAIVGPTPVPASPPASTSGGMYSIEEIRAEMARLSGKVEELEHEKQMREGQRTEEQAKLQEKIAGLEKQLQESQAPKGPALPEGKTPFEAGKDAYFNEHYDEAIAYLDKALSVKETGKEAEEAFYIQGESYFKLKNYQKAIVNYSKFPEKFPKSAYHSKSLLRIAECFEAMGMKDDAKAFYQNLVEQFPKTAEGKLAKKRLATKKK
jgi:TolA-binding protein